MKTVRGIELTVDGNDVTATFPGGDAYGIAKDVLFDRSGFMIDQLIANFRFAHLITGDGDPSNGVLKQYLNTFKQPAGLQLIHWNPVFVTVVQQTGGGDRWDLQYGFTASDRGYSTEFSADDLADVFDPNPTLWNIGSYLRLMGFDDLTSEAIAAVRSANFRVLGN